MWNTHQHHSTGPPQTCLPIHYSSTSLLGSLHCVILNPKTLSQLALHPPCHAVPPKPTRVTHHFPAWPAKAGAGTAAAADTWGHLEGPAEPQVRWLAQAGPCDCAKHLCPQHHTTAAATALGTPAPPLLRSSFATQLLCRPCSDPSYRPTSIHGGWHLEKGGPHKTHALAAQPQGHTHTCPRPACHTSRPSAAASGSWPTPMPHSCQRRLAPCTAGTTRQGSGNTASR